MKRIMRPTEMTPAEISELLAVLEKAKITRGYLKQISLRPEIARDIFKLLIELFEGDLSFVYTLILLPEEQIKAWKKANRQGKLGIDDDEFNFIPSSPSLSLRDREDGFVGVCLFYGFGSGGEYSDLILSGKKAWEFIGRSVNTWKSPSIDFNDSTLLRVRDSAHFRPLGFYWKKVQLGYAHRDLSPDNVRKNIIEIKIDWGMGPEGIQFLLTHPHYIKELGANEKTPNIDLVDYVIESNNGGGFNKIPCLALDRKRSKLALISEDTADTDIKFGAGSLRD